MKRAGDSFAKHRVAAAVCLLITFASDLPPLPSAFAETDLRCSNRIVSLGATPVEVTDRCGEPLHVEQWEEQVDGFVTQWFDYETGRYQDLPRRIETPVRMERWTYDFGANRFIRYLTFQNGRLIKIETGDKGSR
jgi:hypothetical protein